MITGRLAKAIEKASPATAGQIKRLNALLVKQETTVKRAFKVFLQNTRSKAVVEQVISYLQRNDVTAALNLVDAHVQSFANVIPKIFASSGEQEAAVLSAAVFPALSNVGISFNPASPRAASIMQRNRLQFVTNFGNTQRVATRNALVSALQAGKGTKAAAREFVGSIGLTPQQQTYVANYQAALEASSRDALSYALRDTRFDAEVADVADTGDVLDADQIATMVTRYRAALLNSRADTIARTESLKALNQGRQEALSQTLEQTNIPQTQVMRTWRAIIDDRTRDTHLELNDQVVGMNEPWLSSSGEALMYPGDPFASLEEIINCRCLFTIDVLPVGTSGLASLLLGLK